MRVRDTQVDSCSMKGRFIEYMDVGGATRWSPDQVVPRDQLLQILERHSGRILPLEEDGASSVPGRRGPEEVVAGRWTTGGDYQ